MLLNVDPTFLHGELLEDAENWISYLLFLKLNYSRVKEKLHEKILYWTS
jgi:hypothetical protein